MNLKIAAASYFMEEQIKLKLFFRVFFFVFHLTTGFLKQIVVGITLQHTRDSLRIITFQRLL